MTGATSGVVGVVGRDPKVTVTVFVELLTTAVTTNVPAVADVIEAVATPLVVVRIVVCAPLSSKSAGDVVENSTAVPFGAGLPLTVTVAVKVVLEPASGVGFAAVSVMVAPVGGVVPPPIPPLGVPPTGGRLIPPTGAGPVGDKVDVGVVGTPGTGAGPPNWSVTGAGPPGVVDPGAVGETAKSAGLV